MNQSEWEFLFPGHRFEDSFALLKKHGVRLAAMTCDAKGSILAAEVGCVAVPTQPVKVADTTGAGDGFVAGFLFQLAQQRKSNFREPEMSAGRLRQRSGYTDLYPTRSDSRLPFPGKVREFMSPFKIAASHNVGGAVLSGDRCSPSTTRHPT